MSGDKTEEFSIYLMPNPDQLKHWQINDTAVTFDLCLCGHTHGGQVADLGRSVISSCRYGDGYRSGWYDAFGGRVLVSNGVGTSKLPVRLGTLPQVHRVTLRRSGQCAAARVTEML